MKENNIVIRTPIWKTRSIGLAEHKLATKTNVEIAYRTKDGTKLYPDTYIISKKRALTYPIQFVSGVKLRIIPI